MIIVGSATPTINKGCPPRIECMMPHIAVDANVSTVVSLPSETNIFGFVTIYVNTSLISIEAEGGLTCCRAQLLSKGNHRKCRGKEDIHGRCQYPGDHLQAIQISYEINRKIEETRSTECTIVCTKRT